MVRTRPIHVRRLNQRGFSITQRGFSITEVLVVLMIITAVLAFALPGANRAIAAYNLRSAADHMAERLTAVRTLAMAKNRTVTFSFKRSTGQYGFDFYPAGTPDGTPDSTDPADPSISYRVETLTYGITGAADTQVSFNSRGEIPIGEAAQTITLTDYGGRTVSVTVNLRGKVAVQ